MERIGNGKTVRIWGDRWIPQSSTFKVQSPPSILDPTVTVNELIAGDTGCWNLRLLEQIFTPEEAQLISSLPLSSTDQPD